MKKQLLIIFILLLCGCGAIPLKYRVAEKPAVITITNNKLNDIDCIFRSGIYVFNKTKLESHKTKEFTLLYNVTQFCFQPAGENRFFDEGCVNFHLLGIHGSIPTKITVDYGSFFIEYDDNKWIPNGYRKTF
jgi:hypothetical protein